MQLVANWANELLKACPADIQSVETFGFTAPLTLEGIGVKRSAAQYCAVQVAIPLGEIIPRMNMEPAGQLLMRICEFYNQGKTQKKLGDSTPQAFLEALRRSN
ncbi:hypothetical protein D3C76_907830 [compost metagenome]